MKKVLGKQLNHQSLESGLRPVWVPPELVDLYVGDTSGKQRDRPCEGCNQTGGPGMGMMAMTNNGPS